MAIMKFTSDCGLFMITDEDAPECNWSVFKRIHKNWYWRPHRRDNGTFAFDTLDDAKAEVERLQEVES